MIEITTCCKGTPIEAFKDNPRDHHNPEPIYVCSKCGKECQIEEVCEDCLGTGVVIEGEHDDIREKKCHCKVQDDMDDDS